jgi:hypothetical protein
MNDFTPGTRVRVADDFGNSWVDVSLRGQIGTVIEPDNSRYVEVEMDDSELGLCFFTEDELTVV